MSPKLFFALPGHLTIQYHPTTPGPGRRTNRPGPEVRLAKNKTPKKPSTKKDNGASLGFEEKLWLAADKLRGSIDAAECYLIGLSMLSPKPFDTLVPHGQEIDTLSCQGCHRVLSGRLFAELGSDKQRFSQKDAACV